MARPASVRRLTLCSSCMQGNLHVQFFGGRVSERKRGYPLQLLDFPAATRAPFETGKQRGSKLQSQRCNGVRHMALLTQGRPGAGSPRVRKALRRVADGLEFFFAPPGVR